MLISHQAGKQIFLFQSMKKKKKTGKGDEDSSYIKIKLTLLTSLLYFHSVTQPNKSHISCLTKIVYLRIHVTFF